MTRRLKLFLSIVLSIVSLAAVAATDPHAVVEVAEK